MTSSHRSSVQKGTAMNTLRLARTKTATALVAACAVLALMSPVALAGKSSEYKPVGHGGGKRVR
jgi:hypothetical protein